MTYNVYVFCYNEAFGDIKSVKKILNHLENIVTDWRSDLPNACYLKSKADASQISFQIKLLAPDGARFFISEVLDNCDGFVSEETWPFILTEIKSKENV